MATEQELTDALIEGYEMAGRKAGYWGRRFLQSVRRNGGLATVKRMLLPPNQQQRKGLDALLEAGHPELTVEAIVLQDRFRPLFSEAELRVAGERLGDYAEKLKAIVTQPPSLYPDDLPLGRQYAEGARKVVRVNAYERNTTARAALRCPPWLCVCILRHDVEGKYGALGKEFIHVHHSKPLALADGSYIIDPVADLRPVCPNCHAMLHRREPPLSMENYAPFSANSAANPAVEGDAYESALRASYSAPHRER
jgi:5-methylcytosine-specific restriction enzyme A